MEETTQAVETENTDDRTFRRAADNQCRRRSSLRLRPIGDGDQLNDYPRRV